MLIYERERDFVMVEQNKHAILSGALFSNWSEAYLVGKQRKSDVLFAIEYHDRAWITLDATPLWNDGQDAPYSFIDLPSLLKLPHYQQGVDWVECQNKYAALLCSMHYAAFFNGAKEDDEQAYHRFELERQHRLRVEIGDVSDEESRVHFAILKFLDKLSIYICINEPGVSKAREFAWYRDGFDGTEAFLHANGGGIVAHWLDEKYVGLTQFPFAQKFEVSVPTKIVSKHAIEEQGIARAYRDTVSTIRTVEVGPMPV
ncbi:DUF3891 family protein [Alicyclobacillus fodiniaquatilis]|uniref:DUF3891 family protein n=1 Tax=Alicyclobacillus fodiniaquatilis TaxID=1661150 RepID=A0ABW4JJK4_9BACL